MRGSYYFIGALFRKIQNAQKAFPGGCNIGSRPIDQHIRGLRHLVRLSGIMHGLVEASAVSLVGNHIYLDSPSGRGNN